MKNFWSFLLVIFFSFEVFSVGLGTPADIKKAEKMLKAGGFSLQALAIKKDSFSWQTTCDDSTGDDEPQTALLFHAIVEKPIKVMQISLNKGSEITFCNGKVMGIVENFDSNGSQIPFKVGKYECEGSVTFTRNGDLCVCRLSKDTVISGFNVPARTLFVQKADRQIIEVSEFSDERLKQYKVGFYKIENGKLIEIDSRGTNCQFEED